MCFVITRVIQKRDIRYVVYCKSQVQKPLEEYKGHFFKPLTHFPPMFRFYTPWKHQKTRGFLIMFPWGIEVDFHWLKMG